MRYTPFAVGDGDLGFFDEGVARRFDRHARQHGARRVLDDARHRALRVRDRWQDQQGRQRHEQ